VVMHFYEVPWFNTSEYCVEQFLYWRKTTVNTRRWQTNQTNKYWQKSLS